MSRPWIIILSVYGLLHFVVAFFIGPMAAAIVPIVGACLWAWVFIALYIPESWWRSASGIQMMSQAVFIALITSATLLPLEDKGPVGEWIALAILVGMAVVSANLVHLLLDAKKFRKELKKQEDKKKADEEELFDEL